MELLAHTVVLFFHFLESSMVFLTVAIPVYLLTNIFANVICVLFTASFLTGMG